MKYSIRITRPDHRVSFHPDIEAQSPEEACKIAASDAMQSSIIEAGTIAEILTPGFWEGYKREW